MSDQNDQDAGKGRLSLRPGGRLDLGKTVDAGSVRQSFSHGRSKVVHKYGYDELPGYGDFDDWRADDLLREVDTLIDRGLLRSTGGRFPKLRVVQRAA